MVKTISKAMADRDKRVKRKEKKLRNYRPSTAPELFAALDSAAVHVLFTPYHAYIVNTLDPIKSVLS